MFFALVFSSNAPSQNEFFAGNPAWGFLLDCDPFPGAGTSNEYYETLQDSIVNGITYKIVGTSYPWGIEGELYRSEGENLYKLLEEQDVLWMDFSASQVGDTVWLSEFLYGNVPINLATAIDSIAFGEHWHKVIEFNSANGGCVGSILWGYGTTNGLEVGPCILNCGVEPICYEWDGQNYAG